jgi:DNA-binding PadR family transcriptional regulator
MIMRGRRTGLPRKQFQTLSEPMYYVLLALINECSGIDIMHIVAEISGGRVIVGPGTVYAMLEKFLKSEVIRETTSQGRKRSYIITEYGRELLQAEFNRLQIMFTDGKNALEEV